VQIRLPCPSAPLQSMAAAASRRPARGPVAAATTASTTGPTPTFAGPDRRRWSTNPSLRRPPRRRAFRSVGTRSTSWRPKRVPERVAGWSDGLRHTRCAMTDTSEQRTATPPMGFGASRRNQPRGSLARRLASPAPSALRVSHPLSGLIPSRPRGSVSRHIRPQAFGPPELFPLSQPLRLSTPSALLPSRSRSRDTPKCEADTRSCGYRAFIRLSIRHPSDRGRTDRCSPGLSPLRGLPDTTAGPRSSPHALHPSKAGCARPAFSGLRPRV
jgi:hypothetical protein